MRLISSEALTGQVIVLYKCRSNFYRIHVGPFLLGLERKYVRLHRSSHRLDLVGSGSDACIEKSDHVVACLAVSKRWLIGNVLEEAQWESLLGVWRKKCRDRRSAFFRAFGVEAGGMRLFRGGHSTVGVTCRLECSREDISSIVSRSLDRNLMAGSHEQ